MAINANTFFIIIALILASILIFIQPLSVQETRINDAEVPQLELQNFTIYELGTEGLKDILIGHYGYRYQDRIEVEEVDYTDSTNHQRNNLQADYGVYNNKDLITLEGNVRYYREDGLKFSSDKAIIHQNDETILAVGPFTMETETGHAVGKDLLYDSKNGLIKAKDITGFYTLTE